jgi:8-oxo-(d)GTP phosphatase
VSETILSAGAVVWRPAADRAQGIEILVVHRPKYDDWSLPKGKREPGEHVLLTAVREVLEETSLRPVLGPRLGTTAYHVGDQPKQVDYWSAVSPGGRAAASHEIDAVTWLPWPLILVRHASAGHKSDWAGDDLLRPLDARGAMDALLLASLLACFAPTARVISSPALRCTETVRPYAAGFGGSVEAEAVLAVPGQSRRHSFERTRRPGPLRHLFRDLVQDAHPAVVCLHRENLAVALAAACSVLGTPEPPAEPHPSLPKGGFWVLHAAGGDLAALERYELLGACSLRGFSTVTDSSRASAPAWAPAPA